MTGTYLPVALTQRPSTIRNELRLTLDVRWSRFLAACGLLGIPLPIDFALAKHTIESAGCVGVILSGGDDLAELGGATPERDQLERKLIRYSIERGLPLLGVCRGMQILVHTFGVPLAPVDGHVAARHPISGDDPGRQVNSYHRWGATAAPEQFVVTARAASVVEAVRHRGLPLAGIMWHPERDEPFDGRDIGLFTSIFGRRS